MRGTLVQYSTVNCALFVSFSLPLVALFYNSKNVEVRAGRVGGVGRGAPVAPGRGRLAPSRRWRRRCRCGRRGNVAPGGRRPAAKPGGARRVGCA